jgi:hypothetical protein
VVQSGAATLTCAEAHVILPTFKFTHQHKYQHMKVASNILVKMWEKVCPQITEISHSIPFFPCFGKHLGCF